MRESKVGRKRIALQMKKEVTDERHGNTFNKWIEKMSEFLEDLQSSRKPSRKMDGLSTIQRITRRLAGFADEVTPAGCGLDFEGISSPQSPVITARKHQTCKGVVGGQAQMIVQESAREMTQVTGSEKVPTTPTTPTARRQDLDQERPSTRTSS